MSTITTRAAKGSALTFVEMDANFTNLNTDKLEASAIGVTVQGYDATILKAAAIGVSVQAYDATILKSADIGTSVQAYDANTAKLNVVQTYSKVQTPATGTASVSTTSSFTFDPSTHGQDCEITLTNAITVTLAAAAGKIVAGTAYTLIFKAGDTSARSFAKGATFLAPAATLPITSGTVTSGSRDVLHLRGVDANTVMVIGSSADVR